MQKRCREKQKQPVLKWQIARCKVMHLMSGCAASSESYINDLGLSGHAKSTSSRRWFDSAASKYTVGNERSLKQGLGRNMAGACAINSLDES